RERLLPGLQLVYRLIELPLDLVELRARDLGIDELAHGRGASGVTGLLKPGNQVAELRLEASTGGLDGVASGFEEANLHVFELPGELLLDAGALLGCLGGLLLCFFLLLERLDRAR